MDKSQRFFEEAAAANGAGDLKTPGAFPLPNWVDPKKVKAGQDFVRNNFFSVILAHFISLIFLLCYSPVRKVLVKTQKSETAGKALKRYLSTLVHIKLWYEEDLLHEEGEAAKDVLQIRKIHSRVARFVEKACPMQGFALEGQACPSFGFSKNAISQLDMIVTQFSFVGFVTMFPSKFGVFADPREIEGFIHLWAVIGHFLGIEDKFNLCLEENRPKNSIVLEKILLPELREAERESLGLCQSLVNGMGILVPFLSFNAILLFVRDMLPISSFTKEHPHLSPKLSLYDAICFYLMTECCHHWLQSTIVKELCNALLRLAIHLGSPKFLQDKKQNVAFATQTRRSA